MTLRRLLALSLLIAPAASAQSTLNLRVEGSVTSILGTLTGPYAAAATGDAVVLSFDVRLPGVPGASSELFYDVDPASVRLQIGSGSDGVPASATPQVQVRVDSTVSALISEFGLTSGFSAPLFLFDFPPVTTLLSTDLAAVVGTYPASELDLAFLNLGGFSESINVEIDQFVIGAGSGSLGTSYCGPAVANSTGASATIDAFGSDVAVTNDVTLRASQMPTSAFGFFLVSDAQGSVANPGGSQGTLCLGGQIGRYVGPGQILSSGTTGSFSLPIDLTSIPRPSGSVAASAGDTWNFQAWYRDSIGGAPTSNFTDGRSITLQ